MIYDQKEIQNFVPNSIEFLLCVCATMVFFAVLGASTVNARPVSFLNGTSIMSENREYQNELMINYTFQRNLALGIHSSSYRSILGKTYFAAPTVSFLAMRENEENRQTNIYLGAGYGILRQEYPRRDGHPKNKSAPIALFDADTETRQIYLAVRHEKIVVSGVEGPLSYSRIRFGLAPYLADFGGLHTWILLQGDFDHWRNRGAVAPMLRFFFKNVLWEMGANFDGAWQFNWSSEI